MKVWARIILILISAFGLYLLSGDFPISLLLIFLLIYFEIFKPKILNSQKPYN